MYEVPLELKRLLRLSEDGEADVEEDVVAVAGVVLLVVEAPHPLDSLIQETLTDIILNMNGKLYPSPSLLPY